MTKRNKPKQTKGATLTKGGKGPFLNKIKDTIGNVIYDLGKKYITRKSGKGSSSNNTGSSYAVVKF